MRNIDASLEAVEEIFAALLDISRLDTGAMKPEITDFRIDELLQRLESGVCAAGAGKGPRAQIHALLADGALGPAPAAAASAEPRLQRHQIYAGGQRAGRLPAPRRSAADRRLRHRHRHSARQAPRGIQGIPPPRPGRAGRARSRPRPLDRRAHRPRARLRGDAQIRCRRRLALFGRGAARKAVAAQAGAACGSPRRRPAHGDGRPLHRQ